MMALRIKRVYEPREEADGRRILVDGLWPRGVAKRDGRVDLWLREIAPSAELRRWYNHDVDRWPELKKRYFAELDAKPDVVEKLVALLEDGPATIVFAARDEVHSNAAALAEYLTANGKIG